MRTDLVVVFLQFPSVSIGIICNVNVNFALLEWGICLWHCIPGTSVNFGQKNCLATGIFKT